MKRYYVKLTDHEQHIQADRFIQDGALEFWQDDDKNRKTKLVALYAAGYWLEVKELEVSNSSDSETN